MKLFITLSKRTLFIIFAATVTAVILIGKIFTVNAGEAEGSVNAMRVGYIERLGYSVDDTAISVKKTLIPQSFTDVYKRYNELQREAGFELLNYCGREVTVYTYRLTDLEDTVVNLMVSGGVIIGGDVSSVRIDGEMLPLIPT